MTTAVLFPGQGSQTVGMLDAFDDEIVKLTLAEASEALGYDMAELIAKDPDGRLDRTEYTQPAILSASIALWRVAVARHGLAPDHLAGHSLGEYSALVAADCLAFADALRLVAARGRFMQERAPEGAGMLAVIGLDDTAVETLCAECPDGMLWPANYNAPGQVVVAGKAATLEWLANEAKTQGARMVSRLAMSVPSHCPMLREAAEALAPMLEDTTIQAPARPVLHNIDAAARDTADAVRDALRRQLCEPVRWTGTQQALAEGGTTRFVECGPGKVLAGLAKRTVRDIPCQSLATPDGMAQLAAG